MSVLVLVLYVVFFVAGYIMSVYMDEQKAYAKDNNDRWASQGKLNEQLVKQHIELTRKVDDMSPFFKDNDGRDGRE